MRQDYLCGGVFLLMLLFSAMMPRRALAVALLALALQLTVTALAGVTPPAGGDLLPVETLALWLGISMFAALALRSGRLEWAAMRLLRMSRGQPFPMLLSLCMFIMLGSLLTNNVVALAVAATLTVSACRVMQWNPVPFLVVQCVCAALGGVLSLTASPSTLILAEQAQLTYLDVLLGTGPFAIVGMALTLALARARYHRALVAPPEHTARLAAAVARYDATVALPEGARLHTVWLVLPLTLLMLALQPFLPIAQDISPAVLVLMGLALTLMLDRAAPEQLSRRANLPLLIYIAALAATAGAAQFAGTTRMVGAWVLQEQLMDNTFMLLGLLGMATAGGALLGSLQSAVALGWFYADPFIQVSPNAEVGWWALLIGVALGGMLPPVGGGGLLVVLALLREGPEPVRPLRFAGMVLLFLAVLFLLAAVHVLALNVFDRGYLLTAAGVAWGGLLCAAAWLVARRED